MCWIKYAGPNLLDLMVGSRGRFTAVSGRSNWGMGEIAATRWKFVRSEGSHCWEAAVGVGSVYYRGSRLLVEWVLNLFKVIHKWGSFCLCSRMEIRMALASRQPQRMSNLKWRLSKGMYHIGHSMISKEPTAGCKEQNWFSHCGRY